jgi:hypothetical protein
VIEAVARFDRPEAPLDRETQAMLRHFGAYVCDNWHRPDNGIWESRGPRRHFTHSRLLCWVALDRLLDMRRRDRLHSLPVESFTTHRDSIRRRSLRADGTGCSATTPRRSTGRRATPRRCCSRCTGSRNRPRSGCADLEPGPRQAGRRARLLYRSEQSPADHEGRSPCAPSGFRFPRPGGGSLEEANRAFEETAAYANRLGLFAEEIDPQSGAALGNFPQAFTHVGLINSALSLARREERDADEWPSWLLWGSWPPSC